MNFIKIKTYLQRNRLCIIDAESIIPYRTYVLLYSPYSLWSINILERCRLIKTDPTS